MRGWAHGGVGAAALVFGITIATTAPAADCGGTVACRCGDRVVRDHVLTSDLGPCSGHGLQLTSGVTLDGAGHLITGRGAKDSYGIYFRGVRGAAVHNVGVTGFHHGVRFRDAHESRLHASDIFGNGNFGVRAGYGVDVAVGSSANVLEGNAIHGNADEGVHLGSGTTANELLANEIYENGRENVYLLASHRNRIRGNHLWGGQNSLFVKDSSENRIENNTLADAALVLRADSHSNLLVDNHLLGAGVHFQLYSAEKPYRLPRDNVFEGGSIRSAATCVHFRSARSNRLVATELRDCSVQVRSESEHGSSENTLVDMSIERTRVELDAGSTLHLQDLEGRLLGTLGRAHPDSPVGESIDLAIKRMVAPPWMRLGPVHANRVRRIAVVVENRGASAVTIADAATLAKLLRIEVESLGACPAPVLTPKPYPHLPRILEPGELLGVSFEIAVNCANDPARHAPAAGDYRATAHLDPSALAGRPDSVPGNDTCPRHAQGNDPGCGRKRTGNALIDVTG